MYIQVKGSCLINRVVVFYIPSILHFWFSHNADFCARGRAQSEARKSTFLLFVRNLARCSEKERKHVSNDYNTRYNSLTDFKITL